MKMYIGHRRRSLSDPVYWVGERWTRPACDHSGLMPVTMVAVVCQNGGAALGCIGLSGWPRSWATAWVPQGGVDPMLLTTRPDGQDVRVKGVV